MKKLDHLDHIEDMIFLDGFSGAEKSIKMLRKISSGHLNDFEISVKMDGSPSIIAGYNPVSGDFFVGTKSIFNKTPKVNYSVHEIQQNHGSSLGLAKILALALDHLPKVIKEGIFHGDFMFDESDIFYEDSAICFKPNTIKYKTDDPDEMKSIKKAKIGIIWHTEYSSKNRDLTDLQVIVDKDVSNIQKHPDIWTIDTEFIDPFGFSKLNHMEHSMMEVGFHECEKKLSSASCKIDDMFKRGSEISKLAMMYVNSRIQEQLFFRNREEILVNFIRFIEYKYVKKISLLKSEKGKQAKSKQAREIINRILFESGSREAVMDAFEIHAWLQSLKNQLISKLDHASMLSPLECYIDDVRSGPEGYVCFDKRSNHIVKLVNRQKFSRANFNTQTY